MYHWILNTTIKKIGEEQWLGLKMLKEQKYNPAFQDRIIEENIYTYNFPAIC